MAVQDQEGAAGYSGPREQVHRQTLQETVCSGPGQGWWPPGHLCHLWLLLPCPKPVPVQRHGCSCCSAC